MQRKVRFKSDGIDIAGVLHIPDGHKPGQRLPAFIVLHGFTGSKDESHAEIQARMLEGWGYAALRIDFRGLGESGGERGELLQREIAAAAPQQGAQDGDAPIASP